jgi:hypothetical protein
MKNALVVFVAILFVSMLALSVFSACAVCPIDEELPAFSVMGEVGPWVKENIEYTLDPLGGLWDSWQQPHETLARKAGDCEDMALLWIYLVYENFGEKGTLVISNIPGSGLHVSAFFEGFAFNVLPHQRELFTISYDDAMSTARAKCIGEAGL